MSGTASFEISLTHAVLNTLHAGYQGKFTALNMLAQLKHPGVSADHLTRSRAACSLIDRWNKKLWAGTPLLAKDGAEEVDKDAAAIWNLFRELKEELVFLGKQIADIHAKGGPGADNDAPKMLVAGVARFSYSREFYMKGLIRFGEVFGPQEVADQWRETLSGCEGEISRVHDLFNAVYSSVAIEDYVRRELHDEALRLPSVFLSQCHDMSQVQALAKAGLTFELTQIDARQVRAWKAIGMGPKQAGYWHAHGIAPAEVQGWIDNGIKLAAAAGAWHALARVRLPQARVGSRLEDTRLRAPQDGDGVASGGIHTR